MRKIGLLVLASVVTVGSAAGDDVRPVQVQVREQEPGLFLVQWQVPKVIPIQATPTPLLPDGCLPEGERSVRDQEVTWIHRQLFRCERGLAGQTIGVDYPFLNATLSTVLRVSLLSGEEHARILAPGEDRWELPEAPPDVLRVAQQSVLLGVEHVFDDFVHIALVVVFCLVGSGRLIGLFAVGQLIAVGLALFGVQLESSLSELGVAIAVVLLAREALRAPNDRHQLSGLATAAGVVHGLGLASMTTGTASLVLAVMGMDATLLVLGALVARVVGLASSQRGLGYAVGSLAVALALGSFFNKPEARAEQQSSSTLPALSGGLATAGSQRVAPSVPDAPIQSFLAIEAFETRHEVLVRVKDVWTNSVDLVPIEAQGAVKERIADMIMAAVRVTIDGEARQALLDRMDFVTVDARGVLPRSEPVPEPIEEAFVGVTVVYPTHQTPRAVTLTWSSFDDVSGVPATVIDPETTRTVMLIPAEPAIAWTNTLSEDPIPTVSAVEVEPRTLPVPVASIPLLALAAFVLSRKRDKLARIVLVAAVIAAPWRSVAIALPSSSAPSPGEARRILASLLPNVYRAFEFREESAAYDRLAAR